MEFESRFHCIHIMPTTVEFVFATRANNLKSLFVYFMIFCLFDMNKNILKGVVHPLPKFQVLMGAVGMTPPLVKLLTVKITWYDVHETMTSRNCCL